MGCGKKRPEKASDLPGAEDIIKEVNMKVTIEIHDDLYKEVEIIAKNDNSSIEAEFEKAVILLTKKRALIRRLMNETCDEFNDAMERLGN